MKKKITAIILSFFMLFGFLPLSGAAGFTVTAEAHSGRTDAYGGHRDNRNASGLGYYHYHCGGHPAHLHPNGSCPYSAPATVTRPTAAPKPAPKLSCRNTSLNIGKGLTLKLKNTSGKIRWSSSNRRVATVNSRGKVIARHSGTCTITASYNQRTYKCRIKVKNPFRLRHSSVTLEKGAKKPIPCSPKASYIKWQTSNPDVATISKSGLIYGKSAGECVICGTYKGKTLKCKITVQAPEAPEEAA